MGFQLYCRDMRPTYLYNGNPYRNKIICLYWNGPPDWCSISHKICMWFCSVLCGSLVVCLYDSSRASEVTPKDTGKSSNIKPQQNTTKCACIILGLSAWLMMIGIAFVNFHKLPGRRFNTVIGSKATHLTTIIFSMILHDLFQFHKTIHNLCRASHTTSCHEHPPLAQGIYHWHRESIPLAYISIIDTWYQYHSLQGLYILRRHHLIGIGIPIINLRWSSDHLRFIIGIPIPVKWHLLVTGVQMFSWMYLVYSIRQLWVRGIKAFCK